VRDAEATLAECLASLSAQTLGDFEIVAADDGSRDGSRGLLDAAARRDPRLRVVDPAGRGLVAALNAAAGAARGAILARMDADDVARPERLERQVERLERDPSVDVLGCLVELVDAGVPRNEGMRAYVEWSNTLVGHDAIVADMLVESPLAHPSVAMRADVLRGLGGYRDFDGPEDYDLWLRARRAGRRFAKVPEVLLAWRDAPTRLSRTHPRYAAGRFFALKCSALLAETDPGTAFVVWGAGPIGKGWARALLEAGRRVRAFVEVDPRKLGRVIHGAPVLRVDEASAHAEDVHLAAVGSAASRAEIRRQAEALGLARVVAVA
jgi:cellulose synthase/poly-beta-1,6-N-acetylglucosamine synthase-like glycosyltransferase